MKNSTEISRSVSARQEIRFKVLRALEENPELSQRQLAVKLGVSLGGVNYAMKALVERGFVKVKNFSRSDNKAAYLYILTPSGIAEKASVAAALLGRKLKEYEVLMSEIDALQSEVAQSKSAEL
ncbi:MarR family EPS-associated transcriptional regulator [Luminiphilus sp.]|nr:MarR family EPS-associated transcriptional regulator [Luminiphilus sp.]